MADVSEPGQAGTLDYLTKMASVEEAEKIIARWDREGGLTYRELAAEPHRVFVGQSLGNVAE